MAEVKNRFEGKLRAVIEVLKAPKGQYNKFGNFHYRSCEDILEAVKPYLDEQGLRMKISDDLVQVGDRYYVKATVTVTDGEHSDSVTAFAREAEEKKGMDAAQVTGSASSYARKYALNGMFDIDDTKDDDSNEQHELKGRQTDDKPANANTYTSRTKSEQTASHAATGTVHGPTDKQLTAIRGYMVQLGTDKDYRDEIIAQVKTFQQASDLIGQLKEKAANKRQVDAVKETMEQS